MIKIIDYNKKILTEVLNESQLYQHEHQCTELEALDQVMIFKGFYPVHTERGITYYVNPYENQLAEILWTPQSGIWLFNMYTHKKETSNGDNYDGVRYTKTVIHNTEGNKHEECTFPVSMHSSPAFSFAELKKKSLRILLRGCNV